MKPSPLLLLRWGKVNFKKSKRPYHVNHTFRSTCRVTAMCMDARAVHSGFAQAFSYASLMRNNTPISPCIKICHPCTTSDVYLNSLPSCTHSDSWDIPTRVRVRSKLGVSFLSLKNTLTWASPKGRAPPSYLNFILHHWFMNPFRGIWNDKNISS